MFHTNHRNIQSFFEMCPEMESVIQDKNIFIKNLEP